MLKTNLHASSQCKLKQRIVALVHVHAMVRWYLH